METTGWEHGGIAADFPTKPYIHHNYLEGGKPRLYDDEIFGEYKKYTTPCGAGIVTVGDVIFEYNTCTKSPLAMWAHAGPVTIRNNNLVPVQAKGNASDYRYWHDDKKTSLYYTGRGNRLRALQYIIY